MYGVGQQLSSMRSGHLVPRAPRKAVDSVYSGDRKSCNTSSRVTRPSLARFLSSPRTMPVPRADNHTDNSRARTCADLASRNQRKQSYINYNVSNKVTRLTALIILYQLNNSIIFVACCMLSTCYNVVYSPLSLSAARVC